VRFDFSSSSMSKEYLSVTADVVVADVVVLVLLRDLADISGSTVPCPGMISVPSHSVELVLTPKPALFPRVDAILLHRCGNQDNLPILS